MSLPERRNACTVKGIHHPSFQGENKVKRALLKDHFLALVCLLVLAASNAVAVYVEGQPVTITQPNSTTVQVFMFGDEFHHRLETAGGYTTVQDKSGWYCYAQLAFSGTRLVSSGISISQPPPIGCPLHLDITPEAQLQIRTDGAGEMFNRSVQPIYSGYVKGVTFVVDFLDVPAASNAPTATEMSNFLNQIGYTGGGNNGSLVDYYYDVSGGTLVYLNDVMTDASGGIFVYTAPHNRNYYVENEHNLPEQAIDAAIASGWDFSGYDSNNDGYIDAVNICYAGEMQGGELNPHRGTVSGRSAGGLDFMYYALMACGPLSLRIHTYAHETGHMLPAWPDLYSYGGTAGIGDWALMGKRGPSLGDQLNPPRPCAWSRMTAGWDVPVELSPFPATQVLDLNTIFRISCPDTPQWYYLIENWSAIDRNADLPGSGLAIWRIDEYGDQQGGASNYMVSLVQADGLWQLENYNGFGDPNDVWGPHINDHFWYASTPPAVWEDGRCLSHNLDNISAPGAIMTFDNAAVYEYFLLATSPSDLAVPWTLTGPNDFQFESNFSGQVYLPVAGDYTVTWAEVNRFVGPSPASSSYTVGSAPSPIALPSIPMYIHPFEVRLVGSVHTAEPVGVEVAAFALNGQEDVFVAYEDSAHIIDFDAAGNWTKIDLPVYAAISDPVHVVAGDVDNDGHTDVFVTSGSGDHTLLRNLGSGYAGNVFEAVHLGATGGDLASVGAAESTALLDLDYDGVLDLFIVRFGSSYDNLRFDGSIVGGQLSYAPGDAGRAGNGQYHTWSDAADINGDWRQDLMLISTPGTNHFNYHVDNNAGSLDHPDVWRQTMGTVDGCWFDLDCDGSSEWVYVSADCMSYYDVDLQGVWVTNFIGDADNATTFTIEDFDLDGNWDIYVTSTTGEDQLLYGTGTSDGYGRLQWEILDWSSNEGAVAGNSQIVVSGDFNADGTLDIYVVGGGGSRDFVLLNQGYDVGNEFSINLVGDGDEFNGSGIGMTVQVYDGTRWMTREVKASGRRGGTREIVTFGIGDNTAAQVLTVHWTHETGSTEINVPNATSMSMPAPAIKAFDRVDEVPAYKTSFSSPFPNPFNPSTTIEFSLAETGPVDIAIYGLDGHLVKRLHHGQMAAGPHSLQWHGRDDHGRGVASGSYFLRIKAAGETHDSRLTLVK